MNVQKTASVEQEQAGRFLVDGTVYGYRPEVDLSVSWVAGQAETTRAAVLRAVDELLAQIHDAEGEA